MINYIGIIICIFMLFLGLTTEKKFFNPITIFYILWGVIFKLSALCLFNLKEASENTYCIILLGLITYGCGYYLIRLLNNRSIFKFRNSLFERKINVTYMTRYRLLYILGIITILFYLRDLSVVISYILNGNSLDYIRKLAQDSNSVIYINRSIIENTVRLLVITPFVMALQPITAVDFWCGRRDKKLLIINIIIIFLRIITDGSRAILVYLLLHLFVGAGFSNNTTIGKNKYNKKIRLKVISFVFLLLGGVALYEATLARSGENVIRYGYYYFGMQPYMFETWSQIVENLGLVGYGFASTNGFWFTIFYIIKNALGLSSYPERWYSIYSIILATDSQWQVIAGDATIANAYVSIFWFLYLDGRIIGILIGMLIYGMIVAKVYISAIRYRTLKSICIYSMILQGICFSFVRLQFADVYYSIAFIYILLFAYKSIINKN
ncbi:MULTISPECIES: oligosaccharide repeat unit polymerase [Clostridium]|uniref:oligosaccharide repeat unit polymerase n=1 Tax=Clostridium TaxID=1485 RepID=UPI00038224B2|nr:MULTISPECIES: oligosaccharide repeat unit polymerase [Clostridium]MBN1036874.1 oligosaccharide repeat unit polymerase [Clostridium botulinum]MBY7026492.1 oligosaccharide repeat unit polymerase [Clostridium botulinum]